MNQLHTIADLQHRTEGELRALFHRVSQALAGTEAGTPERRNGLASLENIARLMTRPTLPQPGARGL